MLKKSKIILAILIIYLISGAVPAYASLSWLEFVNPNIEHLSGDQYRFNTDINWAGDRWVPDGDGWNSAWAPYAALNRVNISISSGPGLSILSDFNPTINHNFDGAGVWNSQPGYSTAGDWYGGLEGMTNTAMTLDNQPGFGWDFTMSDASPSLFTIDMVAIIAWSGELDRYDSIYGYLGKQLVSNSESYSQSFEVAVIPEPATMTLIGLGIIGIGLMRRKK